MTPSLGISQSKTIYFEQLILNTFGRNGIVQNPSKFAFAKETANFVRFEITPTSVHPLPQLLKTINKFETAKTNRCESLVLTYKNKLAYAFIAAEIWTIFVHSFNLKLH